MNTKKYLVSTILIGTIMVLALIGSYQGNPNNRNISDGDIGVQLDLIYEYENIDDWIKDSDYIVVGKAISGKQHSELADQTYEFIFEIEQYLKGDKVSEPITVYSSKDLINIGGEYMLFLDYWESTSFPKPNYTPLYEGVIEIKDNKLLGATKLVGNMGKDELIKNIAQSAFLNFKEKTKYNILDNAENIESLIDASHYIMQIKVTSTRKLNQYIAEAFYQPIEQFKGEKWEIPMVLLPVDIKEGEEYLVFFDYSRQLVTRNDSVIAKIDKEAWEEAMTKLEK